MEGMSLVVDPVFGSFDGFLPTAVKLVAGGSVHLRIVDLGDFAVLGDLVEVFPETDGKTGAVGAAESGGLDDLRTVDFAVEDVGLDLHHDVGDGGAAVDTDGLDRHAGVFSHGVDEVRALIADGFDDRTAEVGAIDATGEADDAAAGVHIPVRSAEAGERGNEIDAVGIRDGLGEFVAAGSLVDHLQFIAQPLDGGAAVEGGAFEAVGDVVVRQCPGDTGDEVALRLDSRLAGVHEQEAAGAVGGLDDAVLERALAEESGGLVADGAGDRSACETFEAGDTGRDETVDLAGGDDLRQMLMGMSMSSQSSSSQDRVLMLKSMVRVALE